MDEIMYDEAVAHITRDKGAAYTFIPKTRGDEVIGGGVYMIVYDGNHETDPDDWFEYNVHYSGGLFRSSSGEEEIYGPDDVPDEARSALYQPIDPSMEDALDSVLEMLLLRLKGYSFDEAGCMIDHMTSDQIVQCAPKSN